MYNDRISWSIPVLAVAAILVIVYMFSCLLGVNNFSFTAFGGYFLLGSGIGYIIWLLL